MKKKPVIVIGIAMLLTGLMIAYLIQNITKRPVEKEPAAEPEEPAYQLTKETMFQKYGNFKGYDSAVSVIKNTAEGDAEEEILIYWFTLIQYGDYEDAYSFVPTEALSEIGMTYSYDAFQTDCEKWILDSEAGDSMDMKLTLIPGETKRDMGFGNLRVAKIEGKSCAFLFYMMDEDGHILPFDASYVPSYEMENADESDI